MICNSEIAPFAGNPADGAVKYHGGALYLIKPQGRIHAGA